QQVQRRLIHALLRNHVSRKYIRIGNDPVGRSRRHWHIQTTAAVQSLCKEISSDAARKRGGRKIPEPFTCRRNGHCVRRSPLAQPVAFVGHKEKGLVFANWSAQRCAELILQIVQLRGIKKTSGVQSLVPEKFVK